MTECLSCARERDLDSQPLRERLYVDDEWRVAHASETALPGWLVVLTRRHVESLDGLTDEEAAALGPLLKKLTRALRRVTGCTKSYVALYAEAEGYAHLHLHVVPRLPDQLPEHRGPRIFALLGADAGDAVPAEERERLAAAIAAELA